MNGLPKTVTRQRHDCDLNPGPSAPESITLTTRLPSHPRGWVREILHSVTKDGWLAPKYDFCVYNNVNQGNRRYQTPPPGLVLPPGGSI